MILVPAKWVRPTRRAPVERWELRVYLTTITTVWRDDGKWWSGWSYVSHPTAAAAKRAVEKAMKARTR